VTSESAAGGICVGLDRLPGFRRLAADYAASPHALSPFFEGHPADADAWRNAIRRTLACPRERDALADIIAAQQRHRGAPPAAVEAAERLRRPGSVAIVTGQQAGLFGGPLLTLLKAVTALKLARRVEADHGTPAVPVFWIEADDHDWEEVASCAVIGADNRLQTIEAAPPPGAGRCPVGSLRLAEEIGIAVDRLTSALPRTEFTEALLDEIRAAYRPGASPADAFGRLVEHALGDEGLAVFDASDPRAKPLARRIFAREAGEPGRTAELAGEAGVRLEAMGYHAQVTMRPNSLALFALAGGRLSMRIDGDALLVGEGLAPARNVLAEIDANPAAFSPNVLLRPIVQDAIFPTAAYVAGPNELAYHAQLGRVYEHFAVPRPLVALRLSATVLEASGLRFLARHGIAFEALAAQDDRVLNGLLESALPPEVESAHQAALLSVETSMRRLAEALPSVDSTLHGAAVSSLGRMVHELRGLREKTLQAAKRNDDVLRRQFARVRAQAFPAGQLQERVVAWVWFLNRHGRGLLRHLLDGLPLDPVCHWVSSG